MTLYANTYITTSRRAFYTTINIIIRSYYCWHSFLAQLACTGVFRWVVKKTVLLFVPSPHIFFLRLHLDYRPCQRNKTPCGFHRFFVSPGKTNSARAPLPPSDYFRIKNLHSWSTWSTFCNLQIIRYNSFPPRTYGFPFRRTVHITRENVYSLGHQGPLLQSKRPDSHFTLTIETRLTWNPKIILCVAFMCNYTTENPTLSRLLAATGPTQTVCDSNQMCSHAIGVFVTVASNSPHKKFKRADKYGEKKVPNNNYTPERREGTTTVRTKIQKNMTSLLHQLEGL